MNSAYRTHQGKVRKNNQDSLLTFEGTSSLYAVADGMGGHRGGNVASAMAVECLRALDVSIMPDQSVLEAAMQHANTQIFERQLHDFSLSGMGTTLTALWEGDSFLLVAHVGDSRAYRYRDGILTQATTDHSLVGELLRSGAITAEMARNYPYRNIVTRAVGTEQLLLCDLRRIDKKPLDKWLLCSDGLTEYASQAQLIRAMELPLEEAADLLLNIALDGGGRDNITLILLEVPA
jgi:serine/threonine protein phosphatase PrpC